MSIHQLTAYLQDPNVRAFLAVVRYCEGTAGENGYRMMFGGKLFHSFLDHPRQVQTFKLRKGGVLSSSAAGAYQFLSRTWDGLVKQWGLPDFTPYSQDRGAVALLVGRKAIKDIIAGRIESAVRKCNKEWASLPGSPYGQPVKTIAEVIKVYTDNGGTIES